eukprot:550442_1
MTAAMTALCFSVSLPRTVDNHWTSQTRLTMHVFAKLAIWLMLVDLCQAVDKKPTIVKLLSNNSQAAKFEIATNSKETRWFHGDRVCSLHFKDFDGWSDFELPIKCDQKKITINLDDGIKLVKNPVPAGEYEVKVVVKRVQSDELTGESDAVNFCLTADDEPVEGVTNESAANTATPGMLTVILGILYSVSFLVL